MKGKYHVIVQNNRIKFEFDIKRNITIIRGDSATGKTTLFNMINTYQRQGEDSGISISCSQKCVTLDNSNWESVIRDYSKTIVFIDEETSIIKTAEFAKAVKGSDNYYVIITREDLPNLPYAVDEVYGIHTSGKYAGLKQTYNSFYRLYNVDNKSVEQLADTIVVEDANSGFEFYNAIKNDNVKCISAGGKSNIKALAEKIGQNERTLIIADGAAFGPEMGDVYRIVQNNSKVSIYLPESFEWVILSSGLIDGNRIKEILEHTEDYADSTEYFSWEQFYTKLLIEETEDTHLHYSKSKLNEVFLNRKERETIIEVLVLISRQIM